MKISFCTDIHLDFNKNKGGSKINQLIEDINKLDSDFVVCAGDISNGKDLYRHLYDLDKNINKDFYYVLGNHDFWGSSFSEVRSAIKNLSTFKRVKYLTDLTAPLFFSGKESFALIGDDGWYDMLNGYYLDSPFWRSGFIDFYNIGDFKNIPMQLIPNFCADIVKSSALKLEAKIRAAFEKVSNVVVLMHVPPFRGASWHNGKVCDDYGAPFFSNRLIGDMLLRIGSEYPDKKITVLSGHTHSLCVYQPLQNITVRVAAADYGNPVISHTLEL